MGNLTAVLDGEGQDSRNVTRDDDWVKAASVHRRLVHTSASLSGVRWGLNATGNHHSPPHHASLTDSPCVVPRHDHDAMHCSVSPACGCMVEQPLSNSSVGNESAQSLNT